MKHFCTNYIYPYFGSLNHEQAIYVAKTKVKSCGMYAFIVGLHNFLLANKCNVITTLLFASCLFVPYILLWSTLVF